MATETVGQAFEEGKELAGEALEKARENEREVLDKVDDAQDAINKATPAPAKFESKTSPADLKARLDWGEPALTILDVRDRDAYNAERITGALPVYNDELMKRTSETLEHSRDIYVYGDSSNDGNSVASQLKSSGFENVSIIEGGLSAWKSAGGPVEGQQRNSSTEGQAVGSANMV